LFDQPEVTMADVTRLVESDPAIISEILAIVNSPLFGFQGAVATAPHAISLLGLDRTRSLVSVLAMRAMMANSPRTPVVRRVWTHSVATAAIAQHLAPYFGVNKDFAHVAGIMHDLGRMGLLAAYTSSYTEIALSAHDSADSIMESERAACNMDHCQAGLLLARSWGLPDVLHNAIARHHEERHADQPASDGLIQLACALADSLQFQAILHRAAKPAEIINTRIEEERQEDIAAQLDTMQAQVLDTIQTLDF
jgi:putative nucleotidyltransferase with HDIG domain